MKIELTLEVDENQLVVVSDNVFLVYGTGPTLTEALRDYTRSLQEYFHILVRHKEHLSPQLQEDLDSLHALNQRERLLQ